MASAIPPAKRIRQEFSAAAFSNGDDSSANQVSIDRQVV